MSWVLKKGGLVIISFILLNARYVGLFKGFLTCVETACHESWNVMSSTGLSGAS
jgi:hypothetical protein